MNFVNFNFSWIIFNLVLALVPVLLTLVLETKLPKWVRFIILFLWFIFLPNTIYLITDIQYLPVQFLYSEFSEKIALLIQYGIVIFLGIFTYYYSLKPFEKIVSASRFLKPNKLVAIVILNFIMAFAVTLGKFTRVHSWYLFSNPLEVYRSIYEILFIPIYLLYFLLFAILINLIYLYTTGFFKKRKRK